MKKRNEHQTILITGATSGIGRAAAKHFATAGYRVFATGRNREALHALKAELKSSYRLETLHLDVTDSESIIAAREEIERRTIGHGIDVLINNAGYGHGGPVELVSDEDVRAQYETNVFGLLAVTRAFVPAMRERGSGRVINISSVGGRTTFPLMGVYNSTKYAIESLSDALRMELAPFGVQVVLVEPGAILTNFNETAFTLAERYRGNNAYAPVLRRASRARELAERTSSGPEVVVRALDAAVRARRARPRYVVPLAGRALLSLASSLPTRVVDWVYRVGVGLTPSNLNQEPSEISTQPSTPASVA